MKFLLLISILALYHVYSGYYGIDDSYIFLAKCPDDKTKTKMCAFTNKDTTTGKKDFLIFNKCGKGRTCDFYLSNMCSVDPKKKKIGGSCNYDEDCAEGNCVSNKCTVLSEGQACKDKDGKSLGVCGTGLYCGGENYDKCVKTIYNPGAKPDKTICGFGLETDKGGVCQRIGTLENGAETEQYSESLCKSGLAHYKDDKYICDTITTDATCEIKSCDYPSTTAASCPPAGAYCFNIDSGNSGNSGTLQLDPSDKCFYYVKTDAKWSNDGSDNTICKTVKLYSGEYRAYPSNVKVESVFYEDFLKDFDNLDLDKINTKDKYFNGYKDLKWKTYKNYLLYQHAPLLKAAGLINDEGKVEDDKDCEYNFIIKHLSSRYTKVGMILFALISMLF